MNKVMGEHKSLLEIVYIPDKKQWQNVISEELQQLSDRDAIELLVRPVNNSFQVQVGV